MSNILLRSVTTVSIPEVVNEENIIYYIITVKVGESICWDVKKRYSEFVSLHDKLAEEGVESDVQLPPKKLLGNKDPVFLLKRRKDLESYLQSTFHFLSRNLPASFADFLDLYKYDVDFVLRNLASQAYQRELDLSILNIEEDSPDGDPSTHPVIHSTTLPPTHSNITSFTPLEMFSISQRLKHPCPPSDPESKRFDFTNVVDECCRLESLNVVGSNNNLGASNIVPNDLQFNFLAFKSLRKLVLEKIRFDSEHITSLGILRNTLMELTVKESGVKTISEILLCDTAYNPADLTLSGAYMWPNLLCLDLSDNKITGLDRSIRYAPAIDTLVLDNNTIDSLDNLTGLPRLRRLSLVNNNLTLTQDLHTVLGQITHIDLSQNNISSLHPFKKLYSLQDLNVSCNKVEDLDEVFIVCSLPCLDNLNLGQNKVNNKVDYRLKTLEAIGTRCREIRLDGEMATQAELDKVSVLMALRVTREKRCPTSLFGNLPNSEQWQL